MNTNTATTGSTVGLDSRRLQDMVKAIAEAGNPTWALISPCGRVWIDDPKGIALVIFQNIDMSTLFKGQP